MEYNPVLRISVKHNRKETQPSGLQFSGYVFYIKQGVFSEFNQSYACGKIRTL